MQKNYQLAYGTTSIAPTVSASPFSNMRESLRNIEEARRSGRVKGTVIGAHLEGPYLSSEQCGAQCPDYITPPIKEEYESLVREFPDAVCRWTYAPENDPDGEFCRFLVSHDILASAGHSNAKYPDMKTAIENGCALITHFYSCNSTVTRDHGFRSLGVIESAYLRDELFVEIIADGKHLPPDLIRLIIKLKGADKVALITDSLAPAGTDALTGSSCGVDYIIEDGVAKLPDRSAFAGSVATADVLVRVLTRECGCSVPFAVRMLTEIPARLMRLNKGEIKVGWDADFVVFDENISVSDVFVGGCKVI